MGTSYPEAVDLGLAEVATRTGCGCCTTTPTRHPRRSPSCSARRTRTSRRGPRPRKLREWLSALKRLLEIGVTISGTRPARDRPGAREHIRASTTRCAGPGRQHRGHAGLTAAGRAGRLRLEPADLRQRPRLRLAGGGVGHTTIAVPQAGVPR
ncbi:MAG: hypothetical protein R2734_05265 [Nocardioides sp.]